MLLRRADLLLEFCRVLTAKFGVGGEEELASVEVVFPASKLGACLLRKVCLAGLSAEEAGAVSLDSVWLMGANEQGEEMEVVVCLVPPPLFVSDRL